MASHKKRFCPKGHDTFVIGRRKDGYCRSCSSIQKQKYKKLHPEKAANWQLKHDFGITLEQKQKIACQQNNSCLICEERVILVVDHCHTTGIIRGLLCNRCNRAIGLFKDNPILLQKAVDYLLHFLPVLNHPI